VQLRNLIPAVLIGVLILFWIFRHPDQPKPEPAAPVVEEPIVEPVNESPPSPPQAPAPKAAAAAQVPAPSTPPKPSALKPEDVVGHRRAKYIKRDPYPKLKSFEKMVSRIHRSIKNPDEFNFALSPILESQPGLRKKLIDDHYPTMFEFGEKATDKLRMELTSYPAGKLIYQNLKVYPSLTAAELDPDLPVCIVNIKYAQDAHVKTASSLNFVFMTKEYPIVADHDFRGIRIKGRAKTPYDISADTIECGFISNTGQADERWMDLEYMHLLYTVPNDRIGITGN
jgi:hypothetical protein